MTQQPMYKTIVGNPHTVLSAEFTAGIDTEIYCVNASFLPEAPNLCTILNNKTLVTVKYTGIESTLLTGVTVIQGYPAAAVMQTYPVGSILSKPIEQCTIQSIQDNIVDHETRILALEAGGGGGDYHVLANKPKINEVELYDDKTSDELNLVSKSADSACPVKIGIDSRGKLFFERET